MAKSEPKSTSNMNKVLLVILLAQVIIVIDSTFMNVSISTLVKDFNTSVTSIQNAITLYTLVMASFMIAGAKLGDIIGRKRAFVLGLVVYSIGTFTASISPSLTVFVIGWSCLEGLGAAIMLPAMMSLIVANFPAGPARTRAYAAFAAIAGIAVGIGPIVGGLFTTYLSWRLAFFSELFVAVYIFFNRRFLIDAPYDGPKPTFDGLGFILSAVGLFTVVEGIVLGSSYGLIHARKDFVVNGNVLLSAGQISPTLVFVGIGVAILAVFAAVEMYRMRHKLSVLLDVLLLKIRAVRAGAMVQLMQNLLLIGVIFALSLYVQMELGYSAIQSGIAMLPLSVSVLLSAAIGSRVLSRKLSPRVAVVGGFVLAVTGTVVMGLLARDATSGLDFAWGLVLIGLGIGTVGSQNQNLMMSSVESQQSSETSGIINTSLNVGSSLGTSLAGAIIISVLVGTATGLVNTSSAFTQSQQAQLDAGITAKAQVVSDAQLAEATAQLPPEQQQAILEINAQARQAALTDVYFGLGLVGLLGILAGLRLPRTAPLAEAGKPDPVLA